jgi:hypothetical protein
VQEVGSHAAPDPAVLEWAAEEGRLVLTHDVQTMVGFAKQRVEAGKPMPGMIEAHPRLSAGTVIEDLYTMAAYLGPGEWEGQTHYLPL